MFTMAKEKFTEYLQKQLDIKGWTRAELSRRSGISQSTLSLIYSEQRNPGPEIVEAIARALNLAQEDVFRAAGLMTNESKGLDPQFIHLFNQLSLDDQEEMLEILRVKVEFQNKRSKEKEKKIKSNPKIVPLNNDI